MRLSFESIEFDQHTGEVWRDGIRRRLEPQPAALLSLLISRAGELVERREIMSRLWGDQTHVKYQDGLNYCIRQIRLAVGDSARHPRLIETIPRRGYRFMVAATAAVTLPPVVEALPAPEVSAHGCVPGVVEAGSRKPLVRRAGKWVALAATALLLIAATAVAERRPNRHHEVAVAVLKAVHDRIF
jgi:DNA-binding winged helix-turn-helix (wHTH) protein